MLRLLVFAILLLSVLLTDCGQVFVGFVSNPGNPVHISGTVSVVQVGFVNNAKGSAVTVTAATFLIAGSTTVKFCGDQRRLFPIEGLVRVDFSSGIYCSTLIAASRV